MCVCVYICIFKFGLGVDSGSRPLSAKKRKKQNPELGPSISKKTQCPKPNPRAPLQKKTLFFLRGKIKMLLSHLLIVLQPHFCSPFN